MLLIGSSITVISGGFVKLVEALSFFLFGRGDDGVSFRSVLLSTIGVSPFVASFCDVKSVEFVIERGRLMRLVFGSALCEACETLDVVCCSFVLIVGLSVIVCA